jgi:uncharacterized protein YcbX
VTVIGSLQALRRYPVKSLGGESLDICRLLKKGIPSDRKYGLFALKDGEVAAPEKQARWRRATSINTRINSDELEIAVPGGKWISAGSAEAALVLSDFMGFAVEILPLTSGSARQELEIVDPPSHERLAIHFITTASLAHLRDLVPESVIDDRRFRPNMIIDVPGARGPVEQEWLGHWIEVGDALLKVVEPCARCGFVNIGTGELPFDPAVLRTIVRHAGQNFGVRCSVAREGAVMIGAKVVVCGTK